MITVREKTQLHFESCQRDVTDMKRSGEWLNGRDLLWPRPLLATARPTLATVSFGLFLRLRRRNQGARRGCVGKVFVQGDEGPVSGVAKGVHVHGVTVRHEEKEEEEIEQEVEDEKEENAQRRRHMCMDGMKVKRQMRAA